MSRFALTLLVCALARPAAAQIAIDQLRIQNSPDVRDWAPTATITKIEFWRGAGIHFEFDKNASWPDVVPQGWNGPIQYTVWILLRIDGQWYGSGIIECWRDRPSTDDEDVAAGGQIARNWLYDARWGPMHGHQPQPGERVGFMLTAGDARGRDVHGVAERTRIVEIAWPAASGVPVPFLWTEGRAPTSAEPPVPTIPADPPVAPVPPAAPVTVLPSVDLGPVMADLAALITKVDQLTRDEAAFHRRVDDAWARTGAFFLKYIAPALAAFFGGKAL